MENLVTSGTQIVIGGVQCYDEGTEETFDRNKGTAVRTLLCAWADRAALMAAISGSAMTMGGMNIYTAAPYPDFPELYPAKFSVKGVGALAVGEKGGPAYRWARVQVTYNSLQGAGAQGEVQLNMATHVITLPKSGPTLRTVESDGAGKHLLVAVNDTPGVPYVVLKITRSMNNMGSLPISTITRIARSPVNSSPIFGFDTGCVIFEGGIAKRKTGGSGTGLDRASDINYRMNPLGESDSFKGVWDVVYQFAVRPALPWDHLPIRGASGMQFAKVEYMAVNPTTGVRDFIGRSDLNELFASGPHFYGDSLQ